MFDLGFFELLVIAVVALIVLGPERLPKAARIAGLWVRKARAQWYSVKSEFEREMAAEELKRSLVEPAAQLRDQVADAGREVRSAVADVTADAPTAEAASSRATDADADTDAAVEIALTIDAAVQAAQSATVAAPDATPPPFELTPDDAVPDAPADPRPPQGPTPP